jgi:hypothetical protein
VTKLEWAQIPVAARARARSPAKLRGLMRRPRATPEEARQIIDALLARRFDGPIPELSTGPTIFEWQDHLAALPLQALLNLCGRALFAPTSLDERARKHARFALEPFFTELGDALGVSARVLHAAVRARRFPLEPPRPIAGYEYLGSFLSEGKLDVADPCHLRKTSRMPPGVFSLSHPVEGLPGAWHVFVCNGSGDGANRTAELAVIHERGFETPATEPITSIGVDAGVAGVFDRACPSIDMEEDLAIEGLVHGLGAYARSGYGDGVYPVFAGRGAGRSQGPVSKLRLSFLSERPQHDATMPARASKRYAPSVTFAVGDSIEHPKFGTGSVLRVAGNKIDVEFSGELRTLIHGKR